jgi:ribosomal-protein-alanine N-acetyltransferase
MPKLQRLRADHAPALLDFERRNRAYFAASVPDRGDDFFTEFDARLAALLKYQDEGTDYFHVLVDADGTVLGRINLVEIADGSAELGFRIDQAETGKGLAGWGVAQVCELAATEYGLTSLRAGASNDNHGSRAVLRRAGFVQTGETTVDGHPSTEYLLQLRQSDR